MSGSNRFGQVLALTPIVLSSTRQGTIWYVNSAILSALLAATLANSSRTKAIMAWTVPVSVCLLSATKAASGHAADGGDFTLAELFQFMHLLAPAVWAGTVTVSGFLVVPRLARFNEHAGMWSYGNRLLRAVRWGLLMLLVSGIYTSDRELNGRLRGLWTSAWGRILVAKATLALLALALGALNRFTLKRPPTAGGLHCWLLACGWKPPSWF